MIDHGFRIVEDVFSGDECDEVGAELSENGERQRAGARHLMRNQKIRSLASDSRMLEIASEALGGPAIPYKATLFEKSDRANWLVAWHQDTVLPIDSPFESEEWGPWSRKSGVNYAHAPAWALNKIVALRIHLDPCRSENGPLRVIPGSHCRGIVRGDEVLKIVRSHEIVECIVSRGGVLVMRPLLIHASSKEKSGEKRRIIHIEYTMTMELALSIRLAVA